MLVLFTFHTISFYIVSANIKFLLLLFVSTEGESTITLDGSSSVEASRRSLIFWELKMDIAVYTGNPPILTIANPLTLTFMASVSTDIQGCHYFWPVGISWTWSYMASIDSYACVSMAAILANMDATNIKQGIPMFEIF